MAIRSKMRYGYGGGGGGNGLMGILGMFGNPTPEQNPAYGQEGQLPFKPANFLNRLAGSPANAFNNYFLQMIAFAEKELEQAKKVAEAESKIRLKERSEEVGMQEGAAKRAREDTEKIEIAKEKRKKGEEEETRKRRGLAGIHTFNTKDDSTVYKSPRVEAALDEFFDNPEFTAGDFGDFLSSLYGAKGIQEGLPNAARETDIKSKPSARAAQEFIESTVPMSPGQERYKVNPDMSIGDVLQGSFNTTENTLQEVETKKAFVDPNTGKVVTPAETKWMIVPQDKRIQGGMRKFVGPDIAAALGTSYTPTQNDQNFVQAGLGFGQFTGDTATNQGVPPPQPIPAPKAQPAPTPNTARQQFSEAKQKQITPITLSDIKSEIFSKVPLGELWKRDFADPMRQFHQKTVGAGMNPLEAILSYGGAGALNLGKFGINALRERFSPGSSIRTKPSPQGIGGLPPELQAILEQNLQMLMPRR